MSNLISHTRRELELAGVFGNDSDYNGMIGEAVMKLVETHSKEGHSDGSHYSTIGIFNRVINFKILTPISSNPSEWMEIGEDKLGMCFQNTRQSTCFSHDGGKTWYDIDDKRRINFPHNQWWIKLKNFLIYRNK